MASHTAVGDARQMRIYSKKQSEYSTQLYNPAPFGDAKTAKASPVPFPDHGHEPLPFLVGGGCTRIGGRS